MICGRTEPLNVYAVRHQSSLEAEGANMGDKCPAAAGHQFGMGQQPGDLAWPAPQLRQGRRELGLLREPHGVVDVEHKRPGRDGAQEPFDNRRADQHCLALDQDYVEPAPVV